MDQVASGSPAAELGLQPNDLIPAIRPQTRGDAVFRLHARERLASIVQALDPGVRIEVEVYRDENEDRYFAREEQYRGTLVLR